MEVLEVLKNGLYQNQLYLKFHQAHFSKIPLVLNIRD